MSRESDDEGLSWSGDDDPTLAPGWQVVGEPVSLPDTDPETDTADGLHGAEGPGDDAPAGQLSSAALVTLGILGGVYLLYTIGWIFVALRTSLPGTSIVGDAMYGLGLWLAVLAAPAWFAVVFLAARTLRSRVLWLVAGAILLLPLPFVMGVAS